MIAQCRLCAKLQDCVKLDPAIFAGDCSAYIQHAPWGRKNEPLSFVNKSFNIRNVIAQKFSRLVVSLSLVSEITERVFKSRLTDYLTCNSLLNSHQSAYCKHHSTETALLYIHDHLVWVVNKAGRGGGEREGIAGPMSNCFLRVCLGLDAYRLVSITEKTT